MQLDLQGRGFTKGMKIRITGRDSTGNELAVNETTVTFLNDGEAYAMVMLTQALDLSQTYVVHLFNKLDEVAQTPLDLEYLASFETASDDQIQENAKLNNLEGRARIHKSNRSPKS